jgi:hypothetical protein
MGHKQDKRCEVSDSEIINTGFLAAANYGGHWNAARLHMLDYELIPKMISESRFNRRLHHLMFTLQTAFSQLSTQLKATAGASNYVLDSFPVPVCDNIRISRCRLLKGKDYRGKWCAMRRYFYGVKAQVLTIKGLPVEFTITPGSQSDVKALSELPLQLPPESTVWADAGYTDYQTEDLAFDAEDIHLAVQRRCNSKRADPPWLSYLKEQFRKGIETTFSQIKARMLRHIHCVTKEGCYLKIMLFIISYTFENLLD